MVRHFLFLLVVGLKGCSDSSEKTQKHDNETVEEGVTDWEGDDVVSWDDTTEDDANDNVTDDNVIDDSSSEKQPSQDEKPEDNKVTDTKKQYTITYIVNNNNATMEATTQMVTYGETFTLAAPRIKSGDDFRFVRWVITGTTTEFKSGIYTIEGDVSLTAVWEDTYSKNY